MGGEGVCEREWRLGERVGGSGEWGLAVDEGAEGEDDVGDHEGTL
jgi:hypothetical protein